MCVRGSRAKRIGVGVVGVVMVVVVEIVVEFVSPGFAAPADDDGRVSLCFCCRSCVRRFRVSVARLSFGPVYW